MKKQNSLVSLVIILLVFGCASPMTPIPSLVESQASPARPTFTALPTAMQQPNIPTATPESPLRTGGPYFAYFREINGIYQLVAMDADGQGRKIVDLPQGIIDTFPNKQYDLDMRLVSPDGHWLAFYTGSAGSLDSREPAPKEFDLTLNLLDLTTGEKQTITPLLSKDYPDNFVQASKGLNDPLLTPEVLRYAFLYGIARSIAWSPDGRYLAFAGQMDGLSSDLYVYNTDTQTILRLTDGSGELQWIQWSPDGKSILHGSAHEISMGSTFDVYVAKLDGSPARYLTTTSSIPFKEWLNSHAYFEYEAANVIKKHELRLVDVDTGQVTKIWDTPFETFAVNESGEWLALIMQAHSFFGEQPGAYLINLKTLEKIRLDIPYDERTIYDAQPFDLDGKLFAVVGMRPGSMSYFVSGDGSVLPIGGEKLLKFSISPDSRYWVMLSEHNLNIRSKDDSLVQDLSYPSGDVYANDLVWWPDSSGFFVVAETRLFSVSIPDGKLTLVEQRMENYSRDYQYSWVKK